MYIPPERLFDSILASNQCIWFTGDRGESIILLKTTSNVIKSIIKGCPVELIIADTENPNERYMVTAVCIYDVIDNPNIISHIQGYLEDYQGIWDFLKKGFASITLIDESNTSVASSKVRVPISSPKEKTITIPNSYDVYNDILDDFYEINKNPKYHFNKEKMALSFESWRTVLNYFYMGVSNRLENYSTEVSDKDDGGFQEKLLHTMINKIYSDFFISPYITKGKERKELTDILIDTSQCYILIESKSFGINKTNALEESMSRRRKKISKNIKKAIRQIKGAKKSIRDGIAVFDNKGVRINIIPSKKIHAIIFLTEINNSYEIQYSIRDALNLFHNDNVCLSFIDSEELASLLYIARDKAENFEILLDNRFAASMENKNFNVTSIDSSLPYVNENSS